MEFLAHLEPSDVVLTVNSRLARYLLNKYPQHQADSVTVWETIQILPLHSWLERLFYQTNQDGALLLSNFQAQCMWQEIVQQAAVSQTLLQPAQLAKLTQQAFETLTQWQLSTDVLLPYAEQPQARFLIDCIQVFLQQCDKQNWVRPCELPRIIQSRHRQKPLALPRKIVLAGFDDLNPSVQALFFDLKNTIVIKTKSIGVKHNAVAQVILDDTEHELRVMAQWTKTQCEAHPSARLGCVVPDLANCRAAVQRVFTDVFSMEMLLPHSKNTTAPFNISAGKSLAQQPMIDIALTLLKWCQHALPIESLSSILQSPYLCQSDADVNMGAQLDFLLREKNKLQVAMTDLFSVITTTQSHYPDNTWLFRLRQLLQLHHEKISVTLSPSEWANHFITLLKTSGWPSNRTQNSDEFQLLEQFTKTCLIFSQCDVLYNEISCKKALQLLSTLLQQSIFQSNNHHASIQIMDILEANGIEFDALWVMGLHDGAWPLATKPHPLIPYAIQQEYDMPHANATQELQFAEQMTKNLQNAAKTVVFSSPAKNADQHYSPSRLLQSIPLIAISDLSISSTENYSERIFQSKQIESLTDHQKNAISDFSIIRGGSRILQLQALCPFKAFGGIRLAAQVINIPQMGIPSSTKGSLIHQVLYDIWETLDDQKALATLDDDALNVFIKEKINHVFDTHAQHFFMQDQPYFFTIEKKRLQKLLFEWLIFEKSRPYFRVIAKETSAHIKIHDLSLTIRLDRVDQLSDDSLLLIDYKTGQTAVSAWLDARLTDPQLPLYAVFNNTNTRYQGLSFAQLQPGKMKLKGLIHEKHIYADAKVSELISIHHAKQTESSYSWDTLQTHWQQSLITLAQEFCGGVATPNPSDTKLCETCEFKTMCRIASPGVAT